MLLYPGDFFIDINQKFPSSIVFVDFFSHIGLHQSVELATHGSRAIGLFSRGYRDFRSCVVKPGIFCCTHGYSSWIYRVLKNSESLEFTFCLWKKWYIVWKLWLQKSFAKLLGTFDVFADELSSDLKTLIHKQNGPFVISTWGNLWRKMPMRTTTQKICVQQVPSNLSI